MNGKITNIITVTAIQVFNFLKGALIWLIGPLDYQITYLCVVMIIDAIFGMQVAAKNKTFSWKILLVKTLKKIQIYLFWLIIFHAFDKVVNLPGTTRWLTVIALLGVEIISSIRATSELGYFQLTDMLKKIFEKAIAPGYKFEEKKIEEKVEEKKEGKTNGRRRKKDDK